MWSQNFQGRGRHVVPKGAGAQEVTALSLAIMHLPADANRRAMVIDMQRRMGGQAGLGRDTVYWEITEDRHREGVWPTARRAWMACARGAGQTHHLVMQDDAIPCRDFLSGAKAALDAVPDKVVTFFANRKVITEAVREAVQLGTH